MAFVAVKDLNLEKFKSLKSMEIIRVLIALRILLSNFYDL